MLAACGKKGDPLPPLRLVPAPAEDVTVRQVGDHLRLSWKAPARNEDGSTEKIDLEKARVLRRVIEVPKEPPAEAPAKSPAPSEEPPAQQAEPSQPAEPPAPQQPSAPAPTPPVEGAEPAATAPQETPPPAPTPPPPPFRTDAIVVNEVDSSALGEAKVYEEPVDSAWLGKRVEYAVVYENGKGRESPLSQVARIEPVAALAALGPPKAEAADGFVAISWTAPPNPPPGLGFSVHRRLEESKGYPERPLNPEPLSAPSFEDRTAMFGVASCYIVSAVLSPPAPSSNVSSPPSEETCITPQDHFPPETPKGLVAVPTEKAILLSWRAVNSPDLKAYRVYRGAIRDGPAELVSEVTQPSYTDESASPGETYYYTVTAIDDAPGTNESAKSEAVEAIRN